MNWQQLGTNLVAATAAGGALSQIPIPPKYAWILPLAGVVIGNLSALFQKQPQK